MKQIILSADGCRSIYRVPDAVADDLKSYIDEFLEWMYDGPGKEKYFDGHGFRYDETAFIDYLNSRRLGPKSELTEKLDGVFQIEDVPERYRGLPNFNF